MAERFDLPKIKPKEQPTMLNREAAAWGILGGMAGGVVAIFVRNPIAKTALGLTGDAVGALYGGSKGKARQERELVEGRVVKQPTVWNGGIWSGLFVGGLAAMPIGMLNSKYILKAAEAGATGLPALSVAGMVAGTALVLGGPIVGSIKRKHAMQRDLTEATAIRDSQQAQMSGLQQGITTPSPVITPPAVAVAPVTAPLAETPVSYKNSVTADEAALLAAKQEEKPKSHVETVNTPPEQKLEAARA